MTIGPEELRMLGNADLLQLPKTAFLCSHGYPPCLEREANLWAINQRAGGQCVVSGFHSRLEQSIFRYLLQGPTQPIIYVLARGIQPNVRSEYRPEVEAGRLLFVTPFEPEVTTTSQETIDICDLLVAELADQLFVPYAATGSSLIKLLQTPSARGKRLMTLSGPDNRELLRQGGAVFQPGGILGGHA
jgi:hypothetical protein